MRVAVIGTGIAGNAAAYALAHAPHVGALTVYERDGRPGGHSATVDVDYDGTSIAVDTGFIVYNETNYPNLTALFRHLGVTTQESDMSFALSLDDGRFEWAGRQNRVLDGLFAQRSNLLSPRFIGMLAEILRFQRQARRDLAAGTTGDGTLEAYLARHGFSSRLRDRYVLPMGGAIWSTPVSEMLAFPARNFIAFFANHRLLQTDRPFWRTVTGGSRTYVRRLQAPFADRIRLNTAVTAVIRDTGSVLVYDARGGHERFDHVIVATHSDQALALLPEATMTERDILSAVRYRENDVYLHRDVSLMPKRRRAWASWNVLHDSTTTSNSLCVSYSMNLLQGIDPHRPLFVTLNPPRPPAPSLTFGRFSYAHPQYDHAAFHAQARLHEIQGRDRISFCGAWTGYGFHEDGLVSGLAAAEALGARAPWRSDDQPHREAAE